MGGPCVDLQYLICVTWDVFDNILDPAPQNPAQIIQRGCGNRLILSQFVNRGTGEMMILYQRVCGFG